MPNPLDFVTPDDIIELGLSLDDIKASYQPSGGGVFHARGAEGQGKTLWVVHYCRYLFDICGFSPYNTVGNITLKGKYSIGYTVLKGDNLKQFLWDLTHKPYSDKIVIIDEIDSEFPARFFADKEQTEIALRLWHTNKLHNYVFMTSHLGNSTDLIIHLASHYIIIPRQPNFETNSMDFTVINRLNLSINDYEATDIIKTMLIYNRRELTEDSDSERIRPSLQKKEKRIKQLNLDNESEFSGEWESLNNLR